MHESSDIAVLAIDGGGSRCRLACEKAGHVTRVETGAANVYSDFEGALAQVREGLSRLAQKIGTEDATLYQMPIFIGMAGISSDTVATKLGIALPFKMARIADDRPAALRGALGPRDGAIIHCGTGSFFALQRARQVKLAGGWGPTLGDEASARWIGWAALNAALRVEDGTLPNSALARDLLHDIGGIDPVLQFAAEASPAEFGALAPRITEAAARGDPFAITIMRQGAAHVADAVRALGWTEGMELSLTGGVGPFYKPYLPRAFARAVRDPMGEPLDGALSLAKELVHENC
ncbi:MAG: ATPase [Rhodobacteraceae bacterium]|nr:ATPase [Paracoccaceae bacterium]